MYIDDAELQRVYDSYPVIWKKKDAKPKLCFMGCPHMSLEQLISWTQRVEEGLKTAGNGCVVIPTVFTAAPAVLEKISEYALCCPPEKNRCHYQLYLPADVHE